MRGSAARESAVREPAIRVFLLIEDQPIYSCGVEAVVAACPDLSWAGAAGSPDDALPTQPAPDVVLVDAALLNAARGTGSGARRQAALSEWQQALPGARFIVLAEGSLPLLKVGAWADDASVVLPKSVSDTQLVRAIRAVHHDQTRLVDMPLRSARPAARSTEGIGADLTRRERDLLELMARGLSNHDISGNLKIALPTVKFHIGNILSKLNAYNRTSAVLVALRHNLVQLS